ncbi:MAG: 4-hydroxyphenylacetate 3-hydroxylase N-terminal domain-containing protein [Gammaproteobacteria bacterium]
MIKTGKQHGESLVDGRRVFLEGLQVADVTRHTAFERSVASVCRLYDFQSDPANRTLMTFEAPESGTLANRMWQLPRSREELKERREAMTAWALLHAGFLGRSPDHVASCITGMYMGLEIFQQYDPQRAGALADYYRYARDNDIYLTYVIINPQADRSKATGQQADPFLTAGIVDRDARGITIRGAKMLGTGAIMANEVLVTCIQPLQPGDERYAVSFAIPLNAPGVTILSRKSYEQAARSVFDNPFSSRYDENDSLIYFDDVKVPWERVFVAGDLAMCQKQFHATPGHILQNYQAQIRLMVKLRFLAGIAHRIATMNGIIQFPQVRETLGQLAAEAAMVEGLVLAMEARGCMQGAYFVPDRHMLYAAQVLTQQMYPRFVDALRELAGGGMIMLPSSIADFANAELRSLIQKTQQSPAANAEDRVKFYKLAWDVVGSEYGSRHTQYEMFYAGATFVTRGHSFRCYDWTSSSALLDGFLASYSLDEELAANTGDRHVHQ